jgi:OHCU decarboxylase
MITIDQLNAMSERDFIATLERIFEHSPWVPARSAAARPFASRLQLLDAMRATVDAATTEEQLALIRAHPRLGSRGPGEALTEASAGEQNRAGLQAAGVEDRTRLEQLNNLYQEKFGFPFVLAVRGHTPSSIIAGCESRLRNDAQLEQHLALREIGLIAQFRLAEVIA